MPSFSLSFSLSFSCLRVQRVDADKYASNDYILLLCEFVQLNKQVQHDSHTCLCMIYVRTPVTNCA